jgi:hypothetical protein
MYLKKIKQKNGRIYLSIVDGYYDKERKHARTVTVEKLGYLDELEKKFDDPITFFNEKVSRMKIEKAEKKAEISLSFSPDEIINPNQVYRRNFGYCVLSNIYHELEIDDFILNRQRSEAFEFNANEIMKLLVFSRLLYPASKKHTYETRSMFYEKGNYTLDDVYRSLTFFNKHKEALQLWINDRIRQKYGRDTRLMYYDVTNYYFEINGPEGYCYKYKDTEGQHIPDGFRKRGANKEHRPDPIVQMGLFIDDNGLPVTYQLFPGNTNDCLTYRPNLSRVKREYGLGKVIIVADKGMTTGDNIWYTLSAKDGYIFSMSVRSASKEMKAYVLKQTGYQWLGTEYKHKSRPSPRTIKVTSTSGKKIDKVVHEKQVVFYSEKYDKRAKAERAAVIAKAKDMVNSPGKYSKATSYGAADYIKKIEFDKDTGEILQTSSILELDMDKLKEEEALDGYYLIVTSEMDESDESIIEMYRGLWKIEESFRVTKNDLEARPVYVSTHEHIEAHFLTCFISLVIARILEMKTSHKYCIGRLLNSLRSANSTHLQQNYYLFDYFDDVLEHVGNVFNVAFSQRFRTLAEIKKIFAASKI